MGILLWTDSHFPYRRSIYCLKNHIFTAKSGKKNEETVSDTVCAADGSGFRFRQRAANE
ncbi:MAG: hypothetical protein LBL13_01460 [Bacteroidales bacterium]|nr:hypothetical protein [Bacteroidales bacterium]